ncbi:MAG: hypothetical protein EBV41_04475, partial [Actinobacteria bacterium]|nr:hypothetical protein [Actinomycetota bacterium]
MTAAAVPDRVVSAEQRKRARSIGITYLVLAMVCFFIFTRRPGDAGFRITETSQFTLPAQGFGWALGIVLVAVAAACTSAIAASLTNLWLGTLVGALTGVALAAVLAVMSIRYKVDQVIVGFAINFFALGVTSFVSFRVLVPNRDTMNNLLPVTPIRVPLLADVPFIGTIFFEQTIFVYFSFAAVALATWGLYRT